MLKFFLLLFLSGMPFISFGQDYVKVKGTYTYNIGENEFFSIAEAKRKAVEQAKLMALKEAFGEYYHEDVVDVRTETDDKSSGFFYESSMASVKGVWISDITEPVVDVYLTDNGLIFKAEVEGNATEKKDLINIKWNIKGEWKGNIEHDNPMLMPDERFYLNFQSPVAGFVAVYLKNLENNEIACLLPYKANLNGQYRISGGKQYQFFNDAYDNTANEYAFSKPKQGKTEVYKIILVFSTMPFTKCVDSTGDFKHANSLTDVDFKKWISNLRAIDQNIVIEERFLIVK